jgi:hypothetical protein
MKQIKPLRRTCKKEQERGIRRPRAENKKGKKLTREEKTANKIGFG